MKSSKCTCHTNIESALTPQLNSWSITIKLRRGKEWRQQLHSGAELYQSSHWGSWLFVVVDYEQDAVPNMWQGILKAWDVPASLQRTGKKMWFINLLTVIDVGKQSQIAFRLINQISFSDQSVGLIHFNQCSRIKSAFILELSGSLINCIATICDIKHRFSIH